MTTEDRPDPEVESLRDAGDAQASRLAALYEGHRARLLRMVELRMSPEVRARVGASDVLQEAWLEVSQRIGDYLAAPRMPFFLWLRFIAAQRLLKLHRFHAGTRKRDVRRQVGGGGGGGGFPGTTSVALVERLAEAGPTPSAVVLADETRGVLLAALDEMEELDREVLSLRHFEEMSNAETARELQISPDAASKRYVRALERLRKILGRGAGD